jgi:iron(III) transport system substrate-binding protein
MLLACSAPEDVVNVYSGRHYAADEAIFSEFEKLTGIKVNLIKADSDQLSHRIELEGSRSPADLLIAADAGKIIAAQNRGLLQPMLSGFAQEAVAPAFRDSAMHWVALTKRARVFIYSPERVNPAELSDYSDLASERFRGRVLARTSRNSYNQTLLASVIARHGADSAQAWAAAVAANMARQPAGNDRDQIKAIAAGLGDITIANTYYIGLMLNSANPEERRIAASSGIFFPGQNSSGTHINISAMGIAAHSPNYGNALKLAEYLLSEESQALLAEKNYEYPANKNIGYTSLQESWGAFRPDSISFQLIGSYLHEAVPVFDKAGWK